MKLLVRLLPGVIGQPLAFCDFFGNLFIEKIQPMVSAWRDQCLFLYLSPILASWWSFLFCKFFLNLLSRLSIASELLSRFRSIRFHFSFFFFYSKAKTVFISMACFSSFFWLQASLIIFLFLLKIIPKKCYMY